MTAVFTLLLGIVVVIAITVVTGYFVAQEFAYMAVDRSRLQARAETGDAASVRTLKVTHRTSFMLSGAQLGITVTGLLVGYVAEPLIGESIGSLLGEAGVSAGLGIAIGTVVALSFSTVVQMLFGELFPKNLAIARPEPVARWLSRSTLLYLRVAGWLIWVFDQSTNVLLRMLRIEPVHDVEHSANPRDLAHIVADSRQSGDLPPELSLLLDRILDFPTEDVEHAMIPRSRVAVVRDHHTLEEVRAFMSAGHSRYPVLDEDDAVVGVVQLIDLLGADMSTDTLEDIRREALLVPTTMSLPDALTELSHTRNQLACVIDEHGGFVGVLTAEDLAEELVGEIDDEHDEPDAVAPVIAPDGSGWVVPGALHLDEVERAVGHDLPRGDYETLSGLVIDAHGRLPEEGTVVNVRLPDDPADLASFDEPVVRYVELEVLALESHVPATVRLKLHDDPARAQES